MSIDIIRICGAAFIFLCHACNESGTFIGGVLGQFFCVGVPIFFILSGYLHGLKSPPHNIPNWYGKKLKRLLLPLYIFIAILAVVYLVAGYSINMSKWWQTIVPICGLSQNYIPGCGQLWFLTHLLVCYLITPALQKFARPDKRGIIVIGLVWLAVCTLLAYTVAPIWCTLLGSLLSYAVGFYVLPHFLSRKCSYAALLGVALFFCCCRLAFRHFFDETPFYNSVATEICSLGLALPIVIFLFQLGKRFDDAASSTVKLRIAGLSKRTYEFYLVHYIFLTGPLKVALPHYWQSALAAFALAVVLAELVHFLSNILNGKLGKTNAHPHHFHASL